MNALLNKISTDAYVHEHQNVFVYIQFICIWLSVSHRSSITWFFQTRVNIETYNTTQTFCTTTDPFYQHGLTLIPAWISNHMPSEVWGKLSYPFPNFNGCASKVPKNLFSDWCWKTKVKKYFNFCLYVFVLIYESLVVSSRIVVDARDAWRFGYCDVLRVVHKTPLLRRSNRLWRHIVCTCL